MKIRGKWSYLYRAVDREGQTVDFRLSINRDVKAAKAFFRKALETQGRAPVSITLDGYAASHRAVRELPAQSTRWKHTRLRSSKYLNNMIAQDHRGACQPHARLQALRSRGGDNRRRGIAASNPQGPIQSRPVAPERPSCARSLERGTFGLTAATHSRRRSVARKIRTRAHAISIAPQQLDQIPAAAAEDKDVTAVRIFSERGLHFDGERVVGGCQAHGQQHGRRRVKRLQFALAIAPPLEQQLGVDAVGNRNGRHGRPELHAELDQPRLKGAVVMATRWSFE